MNPGDPNERRAQAGEYVLGTLSADERREFEWAVAIDPASRTEQFWWEARLANLALRLGPVAPRPTVWLDLAQLTAAGASARGSRFTTAWAALATAASMVLGFGLYREKMQPPPEPRIERVEVPVLAQTFVALLQIPESSMHWTVSAVPASNQLVVLAGGEVPAVAKHRDAELWLITDGGPVSLGVIPKTGELHRALPANLPLSPGRTVAVSLEPPGGSPTGKPTGPVVTTATVLQAS